MTALQGNAELTCFCSECFGRRHVWIQHWAEGLANAFGSVAIHLTPAFSTPELKSVYRKHLPEDLPDLYHSTNRKTEAEDGEVTEQRRTAPFQSLCQMYRTSEIHGAAVSFYPELSLQKQNHGPRKRHGHLWQWVVLAVPAGPGLPLHTKPGKARNEGRSLVKIMRKRRW